MKHTEFSRLCTYSCYLDNISAVLQPISEAGAKQVGKAFRGQQMERSEAVTGGVQGERTVNGDTHRALTFGVCPRGSGLRCVPVDHDTSSEPSP